MKVVEQWIIKNMLYLKTEDGKYFYSAGRAHYEEVIDEKIKELLEK